MEQDPTRIIMGNPTKRNRIRQEEMGNPTRRNEKSAARRNRKYNK